MERAERTVGRAPRTVVHLRTDVIEALIEVFLVIMTTFEVFVVFGSLTHLLCHQSDAPVAHGIFHRDGSSLGQLITRDISFFQNKRHTFLLRIRSRCRHGVESTLGVKTLEALHIGIRNHRNRAITRHTLRFATHQRPDRKFALLVEDAKVRIDEIRNHIRLDDGKERIQRAVRIPQRESRIVFPRVGLVNLVVVPTELAIHVAIERRVNKHVVHRGIEDFLGTLVVGFDLDSRQFIVPLRFGSRTDFIEGPTRHFGIQVSRRILAADGRERQFDLDRSGSFKSNHTLDGFALQLVFAGRSIVVEYLQRSYRLFGLHHEINLVLRTPATGETIALDGVVIYFLEVSIVCLVAIAFLEVDKEALLAFRISDAVDGSTLGSRHLRFYPIIHQQGVVTGSHLLIAVFIIGRGCTFDIILFATCRAHCAGIRHQEDIAQVGTTRSAQVRMTEADDDAIRIVITGAPVPTFVDVLRTRLNHTERNIGADKDVAMLT